MKKKGIELEKLSRYRGELMGLAIIFVMLFHVGLHRGDMFFGLKRMGNIGVDMFLFLSGIGLWFSWSQTPHTMKFLYKRILRIYPVWLIVATLYYVPDFYFPNLVKHSGHSTNAIDLIGDIAINWDFWINDELTFWYIPATMMLYLFTPVYLRLIIKTPVYRWLPAVMMVWSVIVAYIALIHNTVGHIEIFWSRLPIYFIGLNFGIAVKEKKRLDGSAIWLIGFVFLLTLSTCIYLEQVKHGRFPLFLERMVYIPLTITSLLLLCELLTKTPQGLRKIFLFIGGISLEIYLIHHHFILIYIEQLKCTYWVKFSLTLAITLPLAWLLHKGVNKLVRVIETKIASA